MISKKHWIIIGICLVSVFFSSSLFAANKPIKLNWVSFMPKSNYTTKILQKEFFDRLNERSKGKLTVKFRGGPEVFGQFDIPKAVHDGAVDIGMTFVGAIEPIVPGVQADMLTQLSLEEERRPGGAYDFLLGLYKKRGLYYLGRGLYSKNGFFYTALRNKKVKRPQELKGLAMGGTTAAQAPALAWGCTYTPLKLPEYYSALERGVVDTVSSLPASAYKFFSFYEVVKYIIDYPVYSATPRVFMNLKRFNSLPKDLQDLMTTTFIEAEKNIAPEGETIENNALRWMVDKGHIELIKFSPEDAKWYVEAAYNSAWEYQQKRFPELTPKLKELFSK